MPTTFLSLGVPADLADRLARRGIVEPFPVQAAVLADALAGRDVCGQAPTGSGKTIAFAVPIAARVGQARSKRPRALVLVPTRELAEQVRAVIAPLAAVRGRTVAAFYGGVGLQPQISALRSGVDIAVACPGRLADLVQRGAVRLDEVEIVVVDEADRMADMGFLPEVRRLLDQVRDDRQTLLFSATLDGDVDVLVRRYQHRPAIHSVEGQSDDGEVHHHFWPVARADRIEVTAQVVQAHWPALVFCRTKRGADRLARQLGKLGASTAAIHGDRSQGQRTRALAAFAEGRVQALIATDVAARGIHVDDVACVVHYDLPGDEKDYLHRSGRTGRAGAAGTVVTLVLEEQTGDAAKIRRKLGLAVEDSLPELVATGGVTRPAPPPRPAPSVDHPSAAKRRRQRPRGATPSRQGRPSGRGTASRRGGRAR